MVSRALLASNVLAHHPSYLYSPFGSLYLKYESARMKHLHLGSISPVLCAGEFYMYPDHEDTNPGVSSSIVLRGGLYEPEASLVLRQLLKEGSNFMDIGANIGWYTLLASRKVGPSGRVVSCEPEPHNFQVMERSVKLNRLGNVTLVQKCLSDRNGQFALHLSSKNAGGHSIVKGTGDGREIIVESTTIDELCGRMKLPGVDVLKIDAESAEPLILSGANNLFQSGQPAAIVMEYSPEAWEGYSELLSILFDEFIVFEIRNNVIRPTKTSDLPGKRQALLLLLRKLCIRKETS